MSAEGSDVSLIPPEPAKKRGRKPVFKIEDRVTCSSIDGEFTVAAIDGDQITIVEGTDRFVVAPSSLTKVKQPKKKGKKFDVGDAVKVADLDIVFVVSAINGDEITVKDGEGSESVYAASDVKPLRKRRAQNSDNAKDAYYTPQALADAIVDLMATEYGVQPSLVLEPSAGAGAFVIAAKKKWPESIVFAVELNAAEEEHLQAAGADVVTVGSPWEQVVTTSDFIDPIIDAGGVDFVPTNPPYSLAEQHIDSDLACCNENGYVAALLRINFLGGQDRMREWWPTVWPHLVAMHPIPQRPSFSGNGKGDMSEYALYVFSAKADANRDPKIGKPIWYVKE